MLQIGCSKTARLRLGLFLRSTRRKYTKLFLLAVGRCHSAKFLVLPIYSLFVACRAVCVRELVGMDAVNVTHNARRYIEELRSKRGVDLPEGLTMNGQDLDAALEV
jgi:hypothetical protein